MAEVDGDRCTGCLTCVRTCPFGIPQSATTGGVGGLGGAAWIDPARCQGCGTCTAECPARRSSWSTIGTSKDLRAQPAWRMAAGSDLRRSEKFSRRPGGRCPVIEGGTLRATPP